MERWSSSTFTTKFWGLRETLRLMAGACLLVGGCAGAERGFLVNRNTLYLNHPQSTRMNGHPAEAEWSMRRLVAGKGKQFSRFACGFAPAFGRVEASATRVFMARLKPCPFERACGRRELRTFTFGDSGKVAERSERGNAFQDLAARQRFEYGLSCGLGRCDLWLTEEQYARLR
jgi:hypothetical protein